MVPPVIFSEPARTMPSIVIVPSSYTSGPVVTSEPTSTRPPSTVRLLAESLKRRQEA